MGDGGYEKHTSVYNINTWKKFARAVRSNGCSLLRRLDEFPNSVLVTGCQRSGTTMLSRLITKSEGMVNYWFGRDDELDAALILSGSVDHVPRGRYCFQTTYLNECVHEYYAHTNGHRIIWVLRHPFSVVHSMLHNWGRFALNELFAACALDLLDEKERRLYGWFGIRGVSRLRRACLAYCGKVSQLFELQKHLCADRLIVLEYDTLVTKKEDVLPELYRFIDLPYHGGYADLIHSKSLGKHICLSKREHAMIESNCLSVYEEARRLVTLP